MSRRNSVQDELVDISESITINDRNSIQNDDAMDTDSPPSKRRKSTEPELNGYTRNGDDKTNGSITVNAEPAEPIEPAAAATPTPTPRRRGRPPKAASQQSTPQSKPRGKLSFETPTKTNGSMPTPMKQAADRSAMRKSVRALIEQVTTDALSDDEQDHDMVVREIYGESDGEDIEMADDATSMGDARSDIVTGDEATTPSKTTERKRRRPRAKSPTPPRDLPPHEMYFVHNKPGRPKTSDNSLSSLSLLTHDEYFSVLKTYTDPHESDIEYLESLHAESFPQWTFELAQGYSICLYGFGSKRKLLRKLATHIHEKNRVSGTGKIVMINGYAPATNIREVLTCIGTAVDPSRKLPTSQPTTMAQTILAELSSSPQTIITVIVNSIDSAALRKGISQSILAQLAAHPQIHLVCSADSPDFTLLWDVGLRSAFDFVFHDCTTFSPFIVELDAVDEVHELLGRKAHRINGREGVAFVLKSLPENAKNLFQLLVGEVLIAMEDDADAGGEDGTGVEYRMIYNKAVEEFICSSEMAFRTLLKEFHDHQIITSRKDALGTEMLSIPFPREELEAILEDLMA